MLMKLTLGGVGEREKDREKGDKVQQSNLGRIHFNSL